MAKDSVEFKEEVSIKKTTVNEKGEPVKTMFFFPEIGEGIEASSYEEALEILASKKEELSKGGEK
jgi:prefoldin subunit 5